MSDFLNGCPEERLPVIEALKASTYTPRISWAKRTPKDPLNPESGLTSSFREPPHSRPDADPGY